MEILIIKQLFIRIERGTIPDRIISDSIAVDIILKIIRD